MTKEQAKALLPFIQAFSEGKTIQFISNGKWVDLDSASFMLTPERYRIKPELKYRSFKDATECWKEMLKHQPFGWIKCKEEYFNIVYVNDDYVGLADKDGGAILLASKNSYQDNTFADGTPFGIREDL